MDSLKAINRIVTDYDLKVKNYIDDNSKVFQPKIFLGAPVRNRAWVLPRYIKGIVNQNIPMETCFIINDCEDNTEQILKKSGFTIIKQDLGQTHGHLRGEYSKDNLAKLRNMLLEEFLKSDCDYLLSIDTDIILPKGSVKQLLSDNKDIVSMLIKNSDVLNVHNFFINGKHVEEVKEGLIPVDMTGAVYLIKRRVIEAGVKYVYHKLGEDIPFCNSAREKGFEIYCDTRLKPVHVFKEGLDLIAKTSKEGLPIDVTHNIKNQVFAILDTCQTVVDYLIQYFKEANIDLAIELIQDMIDAFNKIGESLEMYKKRDSFILLEEEFNSINNSIGLIIDSLKQKKVNIALDVTKNELQKNIYKWRVTLENFFISI